MCLSLCLVRTACSLSLVRTAFGVLSRVVLVLVNPLQQHCAITSRLTHPPLFQSNTHHTFRVHSCLERLHDAANLELRAACWLGRDLKACANHSPLLHHILWQGRITLHGLAGVGTLRMCLSLCLVLAAAVALRLHCPCRVRFGFVGLRFGFVGLGFGSIGLCFGFGGFGGFSGRLRLSGSLCLSSGFGLGGGPCGGGRGGFVPIQPLQEQCAVTSICTYPTVTKPHPPDAVRI